MPVTVVNFTGSIEGEQEPDNYLITVDHPDENPRSFVGKKGPVTWEFEQRVCYYVGNSQGGKLGETVEPNDSVIQGNYAEYKVDSLFATAFKYSRFNTVRCTQVTVAPEL